MIHLRFSLNQLIEDKVGNVNTDASSNFLWSYDNTAPIITVSPASQTLEKGGSFVNPTVTALDNGNDISSEIVVGGQTVDVDVPYTYTITYNVSDTAGNSATEQTHTVTVEDTIAPIITSSNEVSIDENIGTGQVIYTITANDLIPHLALRVLTKTSLVLIQLLENSPYLKIQILKQNLNTIS